MDVDFGLTPPLVMTKWYNIEVKRVRLGPIDWKLVRVLSDPPRNRLTFCMTANRAFYRNTGHIQTKERHVSRVVRPFGAPFSVSCIPLSLTRASVEYVRRGKCVPFFMYGKRIGQLNADDANSLQRNAETV